MKQRKWISNSATNEHSAGNTCLKRVDAHSLSGTPTRRFQPIPFPVMCSIISPRFREYKSIPSFFLVFEFILLFSVVANIICLAVSSVFCKVYDFSA